MTNLVRFHDGTVLMVELMQVNAAELKFALGWKQYGTRCGRSDNNSRRGMERDEVIIRM